MNQYYIYILASASRRLYTGVTNNLSVRLWQHLTNDPRGSKFARKYRIDRLVYFETCPNPYVAISREKQIKSWGRGKKIALIERQNPDWLDLAPGLGIAVPLPGR